MGLRILDNPDFNLSIVPKQLRSADRISTVQVPLAPLATNMPKHTYHALGYYALSH